jgi:hypothetical protein
MVTDFELDNNKRFKMYSTPAEAMRFVDGIWPCYLREY